MLDEAPEGEEHQQPQRQTEHRRPFRTHFDRNPRDQHRREDEEGEDVIEPYRVIADVKDLDQEEDQTADQRHHERRAHGDGDVVGVGHAETGHFQL